MSKRLKERVLEALSKDPTIVVGKSKLEQATGFSEAYMNSLGLEKRDLKKLANKGLALKGYAKRKTGHTPMWVLVAHDEPETDTQG